MPTQLGITASSEAIDLLAKIFETGVEAFGDGVQISDVKYLPSAVSLVYQFIKKMPSAVLELKDLDSGEVGQLIGVLCTRIVIAIESVKTKK